MRRKIQLTPRPVPPAVFPCVTYVEFAHDGACHFTDGRKRLELDYTRALIVVDERDCVLDDMLADQTAESFLAAGFKTVKILRVAKKRKRGRAQ